MIETASDAYQQRFKIWVSASFKLYLPEDPHITREIQELGAAERLLLELEARTLELAEDHINSLDDPSALTMFVEYASLSKLWLFGLYEALRNYRDWLRHGPSGGFDAYKNLFSDIERVRISLAKHEIKGIGKKPKADREVIYPLPVLHVEEGWIGWKLQSEAKGTVEIYRTAIANAFLDAALNAKPPGHR